MNNDNKINDLAFKDEVVSEHKRRWKRCTAKLKVGIALATVMMLLYSLLLYIPGSLADKDTRTGSLLLYILYIGIAIALAFLCAHNYLRGISKFSTLFEGGGRRSLALVRWGFILTVAGVILQVFVFFVINAGKEGISFGNLLIGNILLVVAAVAGIVGFLSLATVKGMTDDGRRGALHMAWSTLVMLAGALLLSYSIYRGLALRLLCTAVNVAGACLFYTQWRRIIVWPDEEDDSTEENQEAPETVSSDEPSAEVPAEQEQPTENN